MITSNTKANNQANDTMNWSPIILIALGQILIVANMSTLNISIGAVVAEFQIPVTSVQSAIVVYSLLTAAFMILGGKLGSRLGLLRLFQIAVLVFGLGVAGVAFSSGASMLILSEALAGLAAAALVPYSARVVPR
jgi:MFS family permease